MPASRCPGMFEETIRNLREIAPLVFGSAPIAFGWLADAMESDDALRDQFFSKLRLCRLWRRHAEPGHL